MDPAFFYPSWRLKPVHRGHRGIPRNERWGWNRPDRGVRIGSAILYRERLEITNKEARSFFPLDLLTALIIISAD